MDEAHAVNEVEGFESLHEKRSHLMRRFAATILGKRFSLDEFRNDIQLFVKKFYSVHLRNVWMVDARERSIFFLEPLDVDGVGARDFAREFLGRNVRILVPDVRGELRFERRAVEHLERHARAVGGKGFVHHARSSTRDCGPDDAISVECWVLSHFNLFLLTDFGAHYWSPCRHLFIGMYSPSS